MAKTINVLGDTQAQQWKSVVHILRACGGDMDYKGRDALCSELDRYIDWAENTIAELNAENERLCNGIVEKIDGALSWRDEVSE